MFEVPGLRLVLGGGLKALLAAFAEELAARIDPFERWLVLVPNRDVEAWLRQELAARLGVCMGVEFRTIREGIFGLIDTCVGPAPLWTSSSLTRAVLLAFASLERNETPAWTAIARLLGAGVGNASPLSRAARARRRMALAEETARLLLAYDETHPEILRAFRDEVTAAPRHIAAAWQQAVFEVVEAQNAQLEKTRRRVWPRPRLAALDDATLPRCRIVSFGHSALAPLDEAALLQLSTKTPVLAYVNSLWEGGGVMDAPATSLLARFGEAAVVSQRRLCAHATKVEVVPAPTLTSPGSSLTQLQRALLYGGRTADALNDDDTVLLLGCVGATRAADAVADAVVASVVGDDEERRRLGDVEVLCAEYETEHALVGDALAARGEIPFSAVASDGGGRLSVFLRQMFSLVEEGLPRQAVLDVLQHPCFRGHPDLDDPLSLLDEAGVYLGADGAAADLAYLGGAPRYHFEQGLSRLLVGTLGDGELALHLDDETLATVPLPFRREGVLALHAWASSLIADLVALEDAQRSGREWAALLERFFEVYLEPQHEDDERELAALRWRAQQLAELDEVVPRDSDARLDRLTACSFVFAKSGGTQPSTGTLRTGGVSLARLIPNRAIPFPVVCVTGLTEGAFPRQDHTAPLDLRAVCAEAPPSPRAYDRLAFVEALLAAEERLVLVYDRLDPVKDAPHAPASVVAELRESVPLPALVLAERIAQPLAAYARGQGAGCAQLPFTRAAAAGYDALVTRASLEPALRAAPADDEDTPSLRQYQECLPAGVQARFGLLRPVGSTTMTAEAGRTRHLDSYALYRFLRDPVEASAEQNLGRKAWHLRADRREGVAHEPLAGDPQLVGELVGSTLEAVLCVDPHGEDREVLLRREVLSALAAAERRGWLPGPLFLADDVVEERLAAAMTSLRALMNAGLLNGPFCRPVLGPARRSSLGTSPRAPLLLGRDDERVTLLHDGALLSAGRDALLFDLSLTSGAVALPPERASLEVMVLSAAGWLEEGRALLALTPALVRSPKKTPLRVVVPPRDDALAYLEQLVAIAGEGLFPVRLPLEHFPPFEVMAPALDGDEEKRAEVYESYLRALRRDWRTREPVVREYAQGGGADLLSQNRFALRDLRDVVAPTRERLFFHYETLIAPLLRWVTS